MWIHVSIVIHSQKTYAWVKGGFEQNKIKDSSCLLLLLREWNGSKNRPRTQVNPRLNVTGQFSFAVGVWDYERKFTRRWGLYCLSTGLVTTSISQEKGLSDRGRRPGGIKGSLPTHLRRPMFWRGSHELQDSRKSNVFLCRYKASPVPTPRPLLSCSE